MTVDIDDLSGLLAQLDVSPTSSASSSPRLESPSREYMTTAQRLEKLSEMRTTLQQRLLLLLVKGKHVEEEDKDIMESEMEEYRDHLDGVDVLIQRLQRETTGDDTPTTKRGASFGGRRDHGV